MNSHQKNELFESKDYLSSQKFSEFVMNALKNSCLVNTTENIPTWAGICSLLTTNKFPLVHVEFLPFIPHPITETSTVYTAMKNFLKVVEQLDQEHLPVFYDMEVFRIMIDIYLKCPGRFKKLGPMLGAFHMTKYVQHCIGIYTKGSGLEESLVETNVFGFKLLESVLNGSSYARCSKGFQILGNFLEQTK